MTQIPHHFGFYAILTDPMLGYETCGKILVDGGVPFLQLRMKDQPVDTVRRTAEMLRKITEGSETLFIVNDDPHLAFDCSADGVHLGQDDMSIAEARVILGSEAIIGLSTHSPLQVTAACKEQPSYIGVGPVFPTPTKKIADPAIGLSGMKAMLELATVPAVAIGGIDLSNIEQVMENGAQNFCMVRQFTMSEEPELTLQLIMDAYRRYTL